MGNNSAGDGVLDLCDKELFREAAFVAGQWMSAEAASSTIKVTNPATGEVIGVVPALSRLDVVAAIDAAEIAHKAWRREPAKARGQVLMRWRDLMIEHQEDLSRLLTLEQGKPLAEARGEIAYAASFLQWFAEEGKRVYGDVIPSHQADRRLMVLKEPVGVCAAITPWNFPAAMITRKAGPALAVGCAMVLKPAEQTPFSALALAVLAQRAGLPAGLLSVVTGNAPMIGEALTSNATVRKLTFTGSTKVGRLLMRQSANTVKKISLELGGSAPFVVCEDADIDAAVAGLMASKYRNTGQTCVCANRVLVHDKVYDAFATKLVAAVKRLKVGSGFEDGVAQGPLIDEQAVHKVEDHVKDAVAKGGRVLVGGERHSKGGTFFQPTVIAEASTAMKIFREETFGPVAPLFRFTSDQEAIDMANDSEYGLASYFYSRDIGRIWRLAEALEAGLVGVNTGVTTAETAPFGGYKQSGIGHEGSKYGVEDYLNIKYVCIAGLGQ